MKHRMRKLQVISNLSVVLALMWALVGGVGVVSAAAPTSLDQFSIAQTLTLTKDTLDTDKNSVTDPSSPSAVILGDERDFFATIDSADTGEKLVIESNTGDDNQLRITAGTSLYFTAQIQWDGTGDSDKSVVDPTGLGGMNLTTGSRDRFIIAITASDVGATATLSVYSSSTSCSTYTFLIPTLVSDANKAIKEIPYTLFTGGSATMCSGATTKASMASVGAVVLQIVTTELDSQQSLDLALEFVDTAPSAFKEFGDLPEDEASYRYEQLSSGLGAISNAFHVDTGLFLGTAETYEANKRSGYEDATATADTEDGVAPTGGTWHVGAGGGQVTVTVTGCGSTLGVPNDCYLVGFVDWSQDGDFNMTSEQVFVNRVVHDGSSNTVIFDIPATADGASVVVNGQSLYSRYRLSKDTAGLGFPTGGQFSGSVEDYVWTFGTTAVSLAKFDANASASSALPFAALLLPAALGMLWVSRRRNR